MTPKRSILALIALIAIMAIVQHRNWAQLRPPQNKSGVATSAPTFPAPVDEGKAEGVVAALEIKNGDVRSSLLAHPLPEIVLVRSASSPALESNGIVDVANSTRLPDEANAVLLPSRPQL